jgi:hypothetical protein
VLKKIKKVRCQKVNRNEYQEYELGVKAGGGLGMTTLPLSYADYLEILGVSTYYSLQGLLSVIAYIESPSCLTVHLTRVQNIFIFKIITVL